MSRSVVGLRRARDLRGVLALVVLALGAASLGSVPAAGARSQHVCNGYAELCRRRFDKVAFAATHNSMSTEADQFAAPEQERSIADQLAGGIRTLLIDVYTGTPTTDHICTDPTPLKMEQMLREQGQEAVDRLLAIRDAQCPPAGGPTAGLYLCHGFCELGATKLSDTLETIRSFLESHPDDVVALILEDYSPAADVMTAFEDAGLARQMLRHKAGKRWPTLDRMRRKSTRLVVFAQNQGGAAPGLLDAFREMNETPYTFHTAADFSCAPNRGPKRASLFLLNHWVDTPDAKTAAQAVNAYDVLGARAKQCQEVRGHLPNFVAVNYAEYGDLLRVVDDLNGVAAGS